MEFASGLGCPLKECEMNNTRYLRTTGSGISDLGIKIICDFYKAGPDTRLDLIAEGFNWRTAIS